MVLSKAEIHARMVELRNLRMLHSRAIERNRILKAENKDLRERVSLLESAVAEQQRINTDLRLQLAELRTIVFGRKRKKDTDGDDIPPQNVEGKPRTPDSYKRPLPKEEDVTETKDYPIDRWCTDCNGPFSEHQFVTYFVEDIPLPQKKIVTKHIITRHWCSHCETYVKSPDVPPIARIGRNALGYILYARYRLRLPMKKIQESLSDLYDFNLSEGEIVDTLKDAETLFGKDYAAIQMLIREAQTVYADETGWRMDGKNWWLWVFATATGTQYVIEDTRGKGVPERMLGNKEDRVIISDGYAAYQNLPGDKQQCWVHLLRTAKLHSPALYENLALLYKKLLLELEKPIPKRNKEYLKKEFTALIEKKYPEPTVEKVKGRMRRHTTFLFTCLDYDSVLPENNTAERAIRPQVVMRKIFGGSRSFAGAKAHQVNSSIIETMRKRNPGTNFFDVML